MVSPYDKETLDLMEKLRKKYVVPRNDLETVLQRILDVYDATCDFPPKASQLELQGAMKAGRALLIELRKQS